MILFLLALAPWTIKFLLYRENIEKDLNHPIAAHFFPTMPISMVILAMDFLKYPELLLSPEGSRALAFWLWLLGSIGIYLFGYLIMVRVLVMRESLLPMPISAGLFPPSPR